MSQDSLSRTQLITELEDLHLEAERMGTSAAFESSGQFACRVLDTALCGIYVYNLVVGHNDYINRQYTRITGWSLDELNAMSADEFAALFHPDDLEPLGAHMAAVMAARDDEILELEYRFRTKDGRWVWCLSRDTPFMRAEDGSLTTFIGTFVDITERKQMEARLRDSEERLRFSLDEVGVGGWVLDLVDHSSYRSPRHDQIFGYDTPLEEWTYEMFLEHLVPEDRARVDQQFQHAMKTKGDWHFECRINRPDGEQRWILATGRHRLGPNGELSRMTGVVTDITERKQQEQARLELEQRLQQTQRLESLGVLAGGIAHDFNNLLMAILGHADLALDEMSPAAPARQDIAEIRTGAQRAAELCAQLLTYSGKGSFERETMGLNELIEEMLHMLKTSISKKCLLNLNLEKGVFPVHIDAAQVRQILMNLVINASEAIGDRSGVISISTGMMDCSDTYVKDTYTIAPSSNGLCVYVEVSDTGCGMDRDTLQRVFEPFFTTKFTGRGLGLSATMGIVSAHDGGLKAYSEPNKGTTFKVLFPAVDELPENTPKEGDDAEWKGRGTVLVVDDEETVRSISKKLLSRLGLDVLTAEDGQVGLELYRERKDDIDVVLLDLTMPHMDGTETYRALRAVNPDVKVILASGYSESDIASRFAGKGLMGCLQKPYSLTRLRNLLAEVLPSAE